MNNTILILTSDWHIRDTVPKARVDDYFAAQWQKLNFIWALQKNLQRDNPEAVVRTVVAGDIYDKSIIDSALITETVKHLERNPQCICIPGQHDLPDHDLERLEESGLGVLNILEAVKVIQFPHDLGAVKLFPYPYGTPPRNVPPRVSPARNLAVLHRMVWSKEKPYPTAPEEGNVLTLAKALSGYDLILSGDNHQQFCVKTEIKGKVIYVVNPGSLMRMTIAQKSHRPAVFVYRSLQHTVERVELPLSEDVLLSKADPAEKKSYVAHLISPSDEVDSSLDFKANLQAVLDKRDSSQDVRKLVTWATQEGE